jgi:SAM-dependent methyltransferase
MCLQPERPDLAGIKKRQQRMWSSGDYAAFGTALQIMGELLCEAVDLRPGQRVLDVATGGGNTALAAARRYADATGIDYVPSLLERGKKRAAAEGLEVDFTKGDAEDIPFADAAFDVVLSTVGVMFAPDQERAANELLRVCRRGGKIGLANWTPNGFAGELGRLFGDYLPAPPGLEPPVLWGTEERLRELLGGGIARLDITPRNFVFRYRSIQHYLHVLHNHLGPTRQAFEALEPARRESLETDVADLVQRFNRSGDETMVVPSDYLEVVAVRNGVPPRRGA